MVDVHLQLYIAHRFYMIRNGMKFESDDIEGQIGNEDTNILNHWYIRSVMHSRIYTQRHIEYLTNQVDTDKMSCLDHWHSKHIDHECMGIDIVVRVPY